MAKDLVEEDTSDLSDLDFEVPRTPDDIKDLRSFRWPWHLNCPTSPAHGDE